MNEQRKDHSHTPLPAPESTDVRMHSPSAEKRLHTPDSHPSKMLASPPRAPKRAQDEKAQGGGRRRRPRRCGHTATSEAAPDRREAPTVVAR